MLYDVREDFTSRVPVVTTVSTTIRPSQPGLVHEIWGSAVFFAHATSDGPESAPLDYRYNGVKTCGYLRPSTGRNESPKIRHRYLGRVAYFRLVANDKSSF